VKKYRNVVLKIGSALLNEDNHAVKDFIDNICQQIKTAMDSGVKFTIVTSGAINEGQQILGVNKRPKQLESLQAMAAIGQQSLMRRYEHSFKELDCFTAQVLLTHDDMNNPSRFLNAKATLGKILELGIIPIINENDVVATEEIRFGDNDTLAGMVTNLIEADLMIILTNQKGYYDKNPDRFPNAKLIKKCDIKTLDKIDFDLSDKSDEGTGGFKTKLNAVKMVTTNNTTSIIASGYEKDTIKKILSNKQVGTTFYI
tara:strand:- start:1475 stop:2245 length:771 start_codon:yes stop_codon:yes gene_type:complete